MDDAYFQITMMRWGRTKAVCLFVFVWLLQVLTKFASHELAAQRSQLSHSTIDWRRGVGCREDLRNKQISCTSRLEAWSDSERQNNTAPMAATIASKVGQVVR